MKTRFISFERPRIAAATMIGNAYPFTRWSASMKHQPIDAQSSLMIYTYTFEAGPDFLRWLMEPFVKLVFDWQTVRRFARMQEFLKQHANEVAMWRHTAAAGLMETEAPRG